MCDASVRSFFSDGASLPAMPEVARRLLVCFGDERVTVGQLVEVIGQDPSLSARLLRLANSAWGAPRQPVVRLADAAQRIGMGPLRGLALAGSVAEGFPRPPGFDRLRFWRQNLATAGYATWLARQLRLDHTLAEVCGLLLRSGQLLMLVQQPGTTALVEALAGPPGSVFALEREHFGCTHAEVSAELAVRWRFPTAMVDALYTAGDPLHAWPFSHDGAVLHAASLMADAADDGLEPLAALREAQPELLHRLGLKLATPVLGLPEHARLVAPASTLLA